jgi:hypothetical protein
MNSRSQIRFFLDSVSAGSQKLSGTIDFSCRVSVSRDSPRLLSESCSLTEASLLAIGIAVVRENGRQAGMKWVQVPLILSPYYISSYYS